MSNSDIRRDVILILICAVIFLGIMWVSGTRQAAVEKALLAQPHQTEYKPIIEHSIRKNKKTRVIFVEYWTGYQLESCQRFELLWPPEYKKQYFAMMRSAVATGITHHYRQIGWWADTDKNETINIK